MKRLVTSMFFVIIFIGCNKVENNPFEKHEKAEIDLLIKNIKVAGNEHNIGLDYVYMKLVKRKDEIVSFKHSEEGLFSIVHKYVDAFLMESQLDFVANNSEVALSASADVYTKIIDNLGHKKSHQIFNIWEFVNIETLSDLQLELLASLDAAINSDMGLEKIISLFECVGKRAILELPDKEKHVVIAAVEIGVNSLLYWQENMDLWIDLLSDGEKSWFNWRQVAAYDVAGAVGGAVATAITGGGVAAGIIGGAVAASAVSATVQIICHFGNCGN